MLLGGSFKRYDDKTVQRALEDAFRAGRDEVEVTVRGASYLVRALRSERPLQVLKHDATRTRPVRRVDA